MLKSWLVLRMRPSLASLDTGLIQTSSSAAGFRFNEPSLDGEQK